MLIVLIGLTAEARGLSGQGPSTNIVNEGDRRTVLDTVKELIDLFRKGIYDRIVLSFKNYITVNEDELNELVKGYSSTERFGGRISVLLTQRFIYEVGGEGVAPGGASVTKALDFKFTVSEGNGTRTYKVYDIMGYTKPEGTGASENIDLRTRTILVGNLNALVTQFMKDFYGLFDLKFNRYLKAYEAEYKGLVREYRDLHSLSFRVDDKEVNVVEYYYNIMLMKAPDKYTLTFKTLTFAYHKEKESPSNPLYDIYYIGGRSRKFEKEAS